MSERIKKRSQHKKNGRTPSAVRRWHRRLGIASALVIILLSITGIMLNHLSFFYSSQSYVSSSLLLDWYKVGAPSEVYGYPINTKQGIINPDNPSDIIWADGTVLINQVPVIFDQQEIIGIKHHEDIVYLFTKNALHLFTLQGQMVESVITKNSSEGVFEQAFKTDEAALVVLLNNQRHQLFSLNEMGFVEAPDNIADIVLLDEDDLNNARRKNENDALLAREFILLKSNVLLDLHSGRIFGFLGPLVMDLLAVFFLILAISGLYLWIKRKYLK